MKIKLNSNIKPCRSGDPIERPIRFDVPEGNSRVVFSHFKQAVNLKTKVPRLRVFWDVVAPKEANHDYRIWKDYPIEDDSVSMLLADLRKIFGEDLSGFFDDSGILETNRLLGKEAEAKVALKETTQYLDALVVIKAIYPVGKFKFNDTH